MLPWIRGSQEPGEKRLQIGNQIPPLPYLGNQKTKNSADLQNQAALGTTLRFHGWMLSSSAQNLEERRKKWRGAAGAGERALALAGFLAGPS